MRSVPRWFTNLHVQDVITVMSVKPLDILAPGFVSTYPRIAIPISIKYLQASESCKNLCSFNCFSIVNSALTHFQLMIKEAFHIEWERPALKHVNLTLITICIQHFLQFCTRTFIFPLRCSPLVLCNLFLLI